MWCHTFQFHSSPCDDCILAEPFVYHVYHVYRAFVCCGWHHGTPVITTQCSWLATGIHTLLSLILFGSLPFCVSKLHSSSVLLCLFIKFTSHPWGLWSFPLCRIVHVPRHTIFYRCSHWELMLFQLLLCENALGRSQAAMTPPTGMQLMQQIMVTTLSVVNMLQCYICPPGEQRSCSWNTLLLSVL